MPDELGHLVRALEAGRIVACPTETLIGLLADAGNAAALSSLVQLKGRSPDNPISLLLPDPSALDAVAIAVPERARALAARHWPGPLTLVLEARPELSPLLCRDGKVGVRVPGPSPALELVRAFGRPLTATSANRAGAPAARTTQQARAVFGPALEYLEGDSPGGPASTVVDASGPELRILRQGAIVVN
jgi:L-threonylcarbamoyladenylate synthase